MISLSLNPEPIDNILIPFYKIDLAHKRKLLRNSLILSFENVLSMFVFSEELEAAGEVKFLLSYLFKSGCVVKKAFPFSVPAGYCNFEAILSSVVNHFRSRLGLRLTSR